MPKGKNNTLTCSFVMPKPMVPAVDALARKKGWSRAHLVREALQRYLVHEGEVSTSETESWREEMRGGN